MAVEEILSRLKTDGWCIVEGVIPADRIGPVRAEVEAVTAAQGVSKTYEGLRSGWGIIGSIPSFVPHVADERVLGVAQKWFGPHLRISYTYSMVTTPGNARGGWHADWPYAQNKAGHIPAPYPDFSVQLSSLWLISDFTIENGGTWIVPGSHRQRNNPTGDIGVDRFEPDPTEMQVTGPAGSVLVFDSRLWHATASNDGTEPRVAVVVRYVPWWLNLEVLMPGSDERKRMVEEPGLLENEVPAVTPEEYASLPDEVKPLYRHWVRRSN